MCVVSLAYMGAVNLLEAAPKEFDDRWIVDAASGLHLYLRHLPPTGKANRRTVLFIHGASFPSGLAAGYRFKGYSWMDDLSNRGFDVWALDFAGYGRSERYKEMQMPANSSPPLGRAQDCSRQIASAVAYILKHSVSTRISLIAHSWGTIVAGIYASNEGGLLDRLVLFGPVAERRTGRVQTITESWTCVSVEDQRSRFYGYVPSGLAPVFEPSEFSAWGKSYLKSDPLPSRSAKDQPCVRVPNGPAADLADAWSGHFPYDPSSVRVPVLIVRGEWETVTRPEDASWLWSRFTGASPKRDVLIDKATHVMHLEGSRVQLYEEVATFLHEHQ